MEYDFALILWAAYVAVFIVILGRIILRPQREPASRLREMVEDIDNAKSTVHLCFYIWLADNNGFRIKDALVRAARRGVKVRVLADALGSRGFIRSAYWIELENAGIDARIALPIGGLIWTLIRGRFDLRNHRKQLIIDNRIAWCGSQNLADPEFRIKSKYAPWVDIMTRWEGPVVQGCQFVFAADWESERGDDIGDLLQDDAEPPAAADPGIAAQVIATGPNVRYAAMTACFTALIHSARRELVVTTPYFVPDEQLLFALLDCARRGVATVMIVPHRNDSRVVAGASRSYYADLVDAGVKLYEYRPGLLHAKTMVVDGEVALIGSANLDRRSFELNFENNILLRDKAFAAELRTRQEVYRADSIPASAADVASFGIVRRLWQNLVATVSPLL
jgi:cardiolipin synthase